MLKSKNSEMELLRTITAKQAKELNIFAFKIQKNQSPAENFESLFGVLSKHRMKLNTTDPFPKNFNLGQSSEKFNVTGVTIMGDAFTITNNLNSIRPAITKFISEYIESDESIHNKFYDIYRCQYLIRDFLYTITVSEPNYYDPNKFYELRFNDQKTLKVGTNNLQFSTKAIEEITQHYNSRGNFLHNILQFLEVKLAQLNMYEYDKEIKLIPVTDKIKEMQLLEVWVALREKNFLKHLNDQEMTVQRRDFFKCFNLKDRNFNSNHNNLKKNKTNKGEFLEELARVLKKWPEKKPRE